MNKLRVGITAGDINGIGLEVILKAITPDKMLDIMTPVIYASAKVVAYHKNILTDSNIHFQSQENAERLYHGKINVVNCWVEDVNIEIGQVNETGGTYAIKALNAAIHDLKKGNIDVLITAPINKHAMQLAKFAYPGHTEFLTHAFDKKDSLMLMVHDNLRIATVTNHVALEEVARKINKETILSKIQTFTETLQLDFGIERPTIAVLGLNPHAGDNGAIGHEEEQIIRPAIIEAKKSGAAIVTGPHPADGLFGSGQFAKYDGILAMYHDQGLIPFKTLCRGEGVNFTAGLPIIRTSPDHGTAMDIAGKNEADETSMRNAIFVAMDLYRNRQLVLDIKANRLKTREIKDDDGSDEVIPYEE